MPFAALISVALSYTLTAPRAGVAAHRAAAIRMDDIPMVKAPDPNVVASKRENFECSFEIPKKGIAEYGTVNMNFAPLLAKSSSLIEDTKEIVKASPKATIAATVAVAALGVGVALAGMFGRGRR